MIALQENKPELASQYTILNNLFIVSEKQFKNIALSYFVDTPTARFLHRTIQRIIKS